MAKFADLKVVVPTDVDDVYLSTSFTAEDYKQVENMIKEAFPDYKIGEKLEVSNLSDEELARAEETSGELLLIMFQKFICDKDGNFYEDMQTLEQVKESPPVKRNIIVKAVMEALNEQGKSA